MERRTFIKAAGAAVGAGGTVALTQSTDDPTVAAAATAAYTPVRGNDLIGESPSGQIESINLKATGNVTWENLPESPAYVTFLLQAEGPDGKRHTVATYRREGDNVPSGTSGEANFGGPHLNGPLLEKTPYTADGLSASEDGETNETTIPVAVLAAVGIPGGQEFTSRVESEVDVVVTNTEGNGNGNGSAGASAAFGGSVDMAEAESITEA